MPSKTLYRSKGAAGFTLVEVMISLTIMSLILTVAFSGLNIGIDSWERGSEKMNQMDRRATVERLIRKQIAMAVPATFMLNGDSFLLFRGTLTRLEFVAAYSLLDGASDNRKIDYVFESGRLSYAERYLFDYVPDQPGALDMQVLGEFARIEFRYLGPDEQKNLVWSEEWSERGLPIAVRVRIDDDFITIPLAYTS